jgi:hypothetical protein
MIIYQITRNLTNFRCMMLIGGDPVLFAMHDRLEESPVQEWIPPRYRSSERNDMLPLADLVDTIDAFVIKKSASPPLTDQLRGCQILSVECQGAECVLINPPRVDCLDYERCKFRMSPDGRIQEIMAGFVDPSRVTVPLFRPYDKRGFNMNYYLCTEEFKLAVEHAKLTGFEFRDISTRREWFKF